MAPKTWLYVAVVALAMICAILAAKVLTTHTAVTAVPTPLATAGQSSPGLAAGPAHQQIAPSYSGVPQVGAASSGTSQQHIGGTSSYGVATMAVPGTLVVATPRTPTTAVPGTLPTATIPSTLVQASTPVPAPAPVLGPVAAATATAAASNSLYPDTGATGTNL